jgi:AhpD family alkylhydroperoxidase
MGFDKRTTELISLGASVSANCQPCLEYHIKKAIEAGITEQEIKDAIDVGRMIRTGSAYKMDQFAASQTGESPKASRRDGEKCGCGCE